MVYLHTIHHFLPHPKQSSFNINLKMILPVKFSGSHCNFHIICWISLRIASVVNPWKIVHPNSKGCPSIRFNSLRLYVRIPLHLLLPGIGRIVSHLSQTEHRVGEDRLWQWNIEKLDCAISFSIPTSNLWNWSGLKPAVHFGKDYDVKNYLWETTGQLIK